jgi:hypothetical protein
MTRQTKAEQAERDEALSDLRALLRPGDTVYTILRHVSRSGMQREIALCIIRDGSHRYLNWGASKILGTRQGKHDGLIVGGCGMDMGFALVYNLGAALWPDGAPEPHGTRNGQPDRDGGYALKHQWL